MIPAFLLSAFSGFLTKTADQRHDSFGAFCGLLYGVALGVASSIEPLVAVAFIPAVLAQAAVGKIDTKSHFLGLLGFLAALAFMGLPVFKPLLAIIAFAAALADELFDFKLPYPRPFLPVAAAVISVLSGSVVPVVAVLLFDGGYLVAEHVHGKK